jgi:hypothetical protein
MTARYLVEITTKRGVFRTMYNTISEFYETIGECQREIDRVFDTLSEGEQFCNAKIYDTYERNQIVGQTGREIGLRVVRPGVWRRGIRYE